MKKARCRVCKGLFSAPVEETKRKTWICSKCLADKIDARREATGKPRLTTTWLAGMGKKDKTKRGAVSKSKKRRSR